MYATATERSIRPSIRLRRLLPAPSIRTSLVMRRSKSVVSMTNGMSNRRAVFDIITGAIRALRPRMRNIFAIFDPVTFAIAISVLPCRLAVTETMSSGRLVPIATMVRPMIACEILNRFAILTAPSTRILPPKVRSHSPPAIARRARGRESSIRKNGKCVLFYRKMKKRNSPVEKRCYNRNN